jgi:glutathione S-transferase
MNDTGRYRVLGGPGSPYSMKMRAILRHRRLPHDWIVLPGYIGSDGELKKAGKGIIPVVQAPDGEYWADTTPMNLELDRRHPGRRSVLPDDAGDRFLSLLIEDFADEWLVLALFDLRWGSEIDQEFCARRQMAGWLGALPKAQFDATVERFKNRQTQLLASMGDRSANRPVLRSTYVEVLSALEAQLEVSRFLFGSRPSIADFALFGQLSQCAIDPSASSIMRADAVRTFQWAQDMDDTSGIEGNWREPGVPLGPGVDRLMITIRDVYLPFMVANAKTVERGGDKVSLELRGMPMSARANRYKQRCLGSLKLALADALACGATELEDTLRRYDCWDALQLEPHEAEKIVRLRHDVTEPHSGPF